MKRSYFVKSAGGKIYVELGYPKSKERPLNAVVIAHGLRSYYPGFLDMFAKRLRDAGYISVKFHFLGTGKSDGRFEEKSTKSMIQNYRDVIKFLKSHKDIKNIGIVGRSNAGSLATLAGPDKRIKAYVLLGSVGYYSQNMSHFIEESKIKGKYFYHPSFKRKHTKGEGRLPLSYKSELQKFDQPLLQGIKKLRNVAFFQSKKDEAVPVEEGHFDYWKKNLPKPKKIYLVDAGNHSFKGKKSYVIKESIRWLQKFL